MSTKFLSRRSALLVAAAVLLVVAAVAIAQITRSVPRAAPLVWRFTAPQPDTVPIAYYEARITCVTCEATPEPYIVDAQYTVEDGSPLRHRISLELDYYHTYQLEVRGVSPAGVKGPWSPISDPFEYNPPFSSPPPPTD